MMMYFSTLSVLEYTLFELMSRSFDGAWQPEAKGAENLADKD